MNTQNTPTNSKPYRLFFISSALLLASLCGLSYAEFYMEQSIDQEVLGFASLVLGAISGTCALFAYAGILWQRIRTFFINEGRK